MLVSVIIPTYNRAGTIERAVDSVLSQSWGAVETIIVDDGSTDHTAQVLERYSDKVRLIRQRNQGPSAARNAGIKAARGEIIAFLDADDCWLPEKLERQVKLLQATESLGVKCCVCNASMVFTAGTVTSFATAGLEPDLREGVWSNPSQVLVDRFLFFNQVVAVRREALEQAGGFRQDLWLMEDYDLALRLALLGPWAFIADPLVIWHEDAKNNSRTFSQADRCQRTFDILRDLSRSPFFGPRPPAARLRRRMRILGQRIHALHLSAQASPIARWSGKSLLLYLQAREMLYWRLPSTPRMATRAV